MSDILLSVNIDHVATLRNVRGTSYPDPVQAAFVAEQAGADGITIHLREDRRHITDRDVYLLRKVVQSNLNLEISIIKEMVDIACELKPNSCCLVPENRQEITTEGGLNILSNRRQLRDVVAQLHSCGIDVSLFLDIDKKQIDAAVELGVLCVELHTGSYAVSVNNMMRMSEFRKIKECVQYAINCGLIVNAGHGLDYNNVRLISKLPIHALHIGHSIISRAVLYGLFSAVQDIKQIINKVG